MAFVKTLVLFAHHDVGGFIDPYVIKYVQELRSLGDTTIVFVSDPPRQGISGESLGRLAPLCNEIYCEHQPARDFGSWRIAWDIAKHRNWIDDCDRLLLVNDSVYNVLPLKEIWASFTGADVYGAVESEAGDNPAFFESFFIAFDMNVKTRAFLDDFWDNFEFIPDMYQLIEQYELTLPQRAIDQGMTAKAFVTVEDFKHSFEQVKGQPWAELIPDNIWGPTWYFWYGLIHYHRFPFLKVKVARMRERGLREVVERHTDYPFHLIEQHVERIKGISWLTQRGDPRMAVDKRSM
jgi:lipopolysaccharide biosynthesis protein